MIKTILVPTDFSKNAERALDYAIAIAKKEKATIILLHALHVTYISSEMPMYYEPSQLSIMLNETKNKLNLLQKKINLNNVNCKLINKHGFAVDLILEAIEKRKPQLVIMGTRGGGSLDERIFGSNTSKIIDKAKCPVIAVPHKAAINVIKNITYATDYKTSDVTVIKRIVDIAAVFNASVSLIHFADGEFTPITEAEYLNKFKLQVRSKIRYKKLLYRIINGTDFTKTLEKYIRQQKPDLLAMSTHHRTSVFDKLFYKSETKRMVHHSKVPLMIFHHKEKPIVTYF